MKIQQAFFVPGTSAFFFDDQRAIKDGAIHDGFTYRGKPKTPGFQRIRKAGECISVMLMLENGMIASGDCVAVQYSGAGGRDPLFLAASFIPFLNKNIAPLLTGMQVKKFREMARWIDQIEFDGHKLHTAIRYGLTQALLDARAIMKKKLKCEIICDEYGLPLISSRIPLFGQSGDNRYENVDKMILKGVDALPHGLFNTIDDKLGHRGEKLRDYIRWLVKRIRTIGIKPDYQPVLHIDVYGTIGIIFENNPKKIASYLASLEKHAGGLPLYIEGPVDMEGLDPQIEIMKRILDSLKASGSMVKIVADEWCNTFEDIKKFTDAGSCHMVQIKTPDLGGIENIIESIIYCKSHTMEAYQGGSCNETDISSRVCVHIAMAARPERLLCKPGMGFDEGFSIVNNEMERIAAVLRRK